MRDDTIQDTSRDASREESRDHLFRRHMLFGWWSLLVFLSLGIALESMHGFKAGFYLDVSNETRRLMWRLAHAHGTLLSLVHLVFGLTVRAGAFEVGGGVRWASRLLVAVILLMPTGFFLGGVVVYGGDPSLGILLVPLAGLLFFAAVLLTARAVTRAKS